MLQLWHSDILHGTWHAFTGSSEHSAFTVRSLKGHKAPATSGPPSLPDGPCSIGSGWALGKRHAPGAATRLRTDRSRPEGSKPRSLHGAAAGRHPTRPGADYEAQLAPGPLPPPGRAAARRHNSPPVAAALPPARGGRGAARAEPVTGTALRSRGSGGCGAGGFPPEEKVGGERAMARDVATGN